MVSREIGDMRIELKVEQSSRSDGEFWAIEVEQQGQDIAEDGTKSRARAYFVFDGPIAEDEALSETLADAGLFSFFFKPEREISQLVGLFFSRGRTINIQMGLGMLVQQRDLSDEGEIDAVETWRRWHAYADGEETLLWALWEPGALHAAETGTVSLNTLQRVMDAARVAATEFQGQTLASLPQSGIGGVRC